MEYHVSPSWSAAVTTVQMAALLSMVQTPANVQEDTVLMKME